MWFPPCRLSSTADTLGLAMEVTRVLPIVTSTTMAFRMWHARWVTTFLSRWTTMQSLNQSLNHSITQSIYYPINLLFVVLVRYFRSVYFFILMVCKYVLTNSNTKPKTWSARTSTTAWTAITTLTWAAQLWRTIPSSACLSSELPTVTTRSWQRSMPVAPCLRPSMPTVLRHTPVESTCMVSLSGSVNYWTRQDTPCQ